MSNAYDPTMFKSGKKPLTVQDIEQQLKGLGGPISAPPWVEAKLQAKLDALHATLYPAVVHDDHMADSFVYATQGPNGAIVQKRISREEIEAARDDMRPVARAWSVYEKLKMRMGLQEGDAFGFHCNIHVGDNTVYVLVASNDKALLLEDDVHLFPSDKLMGQVQLFRSGL